MRLKPFILAAFFLMLLPGGGYLWHRADRAAEDRAEWLSDPIPSDDDTVGMSFSASGFLNRDVLVSVYTFGEEDRTLEDVWVEIIAHSNLGATFHQQGFRRIIPSDSNNVSRTIITAAPQQSSKMQKTEYGEMWAILVRVRIVPLISAPDVQ